MALPPSVQNRTELFWQRRARDLNGAMILWPWQIERRDVGGVSALVNDLVIARDAERERIRTRHWAGSTPRLDAIRICLKNERALLDQLTSEAAR